MRLVLNLIWLLLAGVWLALAYALAAIFCFVLIITIRFGIASDDLYLLAETSIYWPQGATSVRLGGRIEKAGHLGRYTP